MMENRTTAGTTLFASAVKRIRGNVEVDEVERRPALDEARAEERRVLNRGKRERDQERERERHEPQTADHGRGSQAQRAELGGPERPEAGDDGDRDVRQHHHLEQLDETVGRPLQRRRPLAEEQAGEDAASEPDEDLSRERHEATCRPIRHWTRHERPESRTPRERRALLYTGRLDARSRLLPVVTYRPRAPWDVRTLQDPSRPRIG